jgi:hypothetical protein
MKLQASMMTRSSKKQDPSTMRGPSISAARRRGVATTLVVGGATSYGPGSSAAEGRGPRAASTSRSARLMLPVRWGACATATGDGAFRAPPGAGPWKVKELEVPRAAQFAAPYVDALMCRGPPALGIHWVGTFALFWLPRGRPRRFAPKLADPAAAEEAEGSITRGSI